MRHPVDSLAWKNFDNVHPSFALKPHWMFMKQTFFMLSLLILGPTAPRNDIDIYLQPLIDELNDLWHVGVETYDASTKLPILAFGTLPSYLSSKKQKV